jgi:ADP-ribose pyrophosphatase YjhB (NUDIX family)
MPPKSPRLAVRALILSEGRLLLVNAYPGGASDLWCAPGGGVEAGTALAENLVREVREETGLVVRVGALAIVNEYADPERGFHQVELLYRCEIEEGALDSGWHDPAHVVTERRFFARSELAGLRFKPDSLARIAFDPEAPLYHDPMEPLAR